MEKKTTLQDFAAAALTARLGLSDDEARGFLRALFESVEQGLADDKFVKIRGLGTFKLVAISERESVNISTGQRFQIGSHSRVSFTPDARLREAVNKPFAQFQTVTLSPDVDLALMEALDLPEAYGEPDDEEPAHEPQVPAEVAEPVVPAADEPEAAEPAQPSQAEEVTLPPLPDEEEPAEQAAEAEAPAVAEEESEPWPQSQPAEPAPQPMAEPAPASEPQLASAPEPADGQDSQPAAEPDRGEAPSPVSTWGYAAGAPSEVRYVVSETSGRRRPNVWKVVALTLAAILLMALSYCAGYHQLLCPM